MKQWEPGLRLRSYVLTGLVARGGMGEIWLAAEQAGARRSVVIKRLLEVEDEGGLRAEMLLDEARIASQLDHPNIVRVLALGDEDDSSFIVMEYLHGENLSAVVRRGLRARSQLAPACIANLGAEIAAALAYAHALKGPDGGPLGLVHRDVTPQNIVVTYDGVAKLIDFGIARARGRSTVTEEGVVKGKLAYMSPEQGRGEPVDGRSDVFPLGVVLYELLANGRFHTDPGELAMFRLLAAGGPFPTLTVAEPGRPAALVSIVNGR